MNVAVFRGKIRKKIKCCDDMTIFFSHVRDICHHMHNVEVMRYVVEI